MTAVRRLILSHFRNYAALDLSVCAPLVALVGDNGAGKTNILEALSLFSPGRGLRRAEFRDLVRQGAESGFAVSLTLDGEAGEHQLGVGFDPHGEAGRQCRIDRAPASSASAFAEYCRVIWLTPENDGLFRGSAGDRRRFLDRLVLAVDNGHGGRVNALERALRTRNRLLEEPFPDGQWLDAVEREVAETAVAVAAARHETVARLNGLIDAERDRLAPFPSAIIGLKGELEERVGSEASLATEDFYRALLAAQRPRDRAAGRTLIGPHAADLLVRHAAKDIPAEQASTGEQKALLIGLFLAHAHLVRQMTGLSALMLLDEVAAHLDQVRRVALFQRLADTGGQVWMTGTDFPMFEGMPDGAARYKVAESSVTQFC